MQWKCANDLSSHESTTILLCRACSRPGATWSTSSTKDRYSVPAGIMELKCGGPWTWTCRMDRLCTCDMSPQPEYACVGSSRPLPHSMMKLDRCLRSSFLWSLREPGTGIGAMSLPQCVWVQFMRDVVGVERNRASLFGRSIGRSLVHPGRMLRYIYS